MTRPRLPAYGRELVKARQERVPVTSVWIVTGRDWSLVAQYADERLTGAWTVAVGADWTPGTVTWEILAGLKAIVVPGGALDPLPVAAEVADWCAPVEVLYQRAEDISDLAFASRRCVPDPDRFVWPPWWSDEREAAYQRRRSAWWAREASAALQTLQGGAGR